MSTHRGTRGRWSRLGLGIVIVLLLGTTAALASSALWRGPGPARGAGGAESLEDVGATAGRAGSTSEHPEVAVLEPTPPKQAEIGDSQKKSTTAPKAKDKPKPPKGDKPVDAEGPPVDPEDPPADPEDPLVPDAPGAPTLVACTSGAMKDVVTFDAGTGGPVSQFSLLRSASADGPSSVVATASADVRIFEFSVDTTGTAYYAVSAQGAGGESAPSGRADNGPVLMRESVPVAGRVLASSNGEVILALPPGAFDQPTDVEVREVSASPTGGLISLSGVYEITPSVSLAAPATLSVRYTLGVTHFQVQQTLLKAAEIMTYDEVAGGWTAGATGVTFDGTYLSGTLGHFSYWAGAAVEPHGTSETTYCSDGGICHDLSTYPDSSVRYDTRDAQICYNCHGNATAGQPAAGASGPNVEQQFYQCEGQTRPPGSTVHPVATGDLYCTICHDPHADPAASPGLLRAFEPTTGRYVEGGLGSGPGDAFCWTCHGPIRNRRTDFLVPNYWATSGGDRKTGYMGTPHAAIETQSDVTCTACHAEHGSDAAALVLSEIETAGGTVPVTRTSDVCLACHVANTSVYPGSATAGAQKHVTVATSTKALTRYPASTAEGQGCTGCHEPHGRGSGGSYTWVGGRDLCLTCHDASGLTYGADYSYQGPSAFGASGHAGITGGLGYLNLNPTSDEFAAWQSAILPTPAIPGTPVDASGLSAIQSADGVLLSTALQATTGSSDYQMYRFKMPADKTDVATISLTWKGYGEAAPGYPVTVSAWNEGTGGWDQIDSRVLGSPQQLVLNLTPASHIDATGYVYVLAQARYVYDATITSGPTISVPYPWNPSLHMVQWTTAGLASSLVDYGPTTAYGTTVGSADERVTNHVVWITMPAGITNIRVRSATSFGESAASANTVITYPRPTIASTIPSSLIWYDVPVSTTLTWNAMSAPGGPFQYRVQVLRSGSQVVLTDWMSNLSYVYSTSTPAGYTWRVEARDAAQISYGWSATASFGVADGNYTGSCPFLFT
ncbi:MAG: cytochrome c3 family protein, partial [Coriobacteriia bacterium]|nr:cytochrome c3 family protein [Coriobacteriia bacterium]